MIKKTSCIFFSIILIFANCMIVKASTATVSLKPSSTSVKSGDTFSVTLSVSCDDGINGITGITYSYDKNILELVSSSVKDSNFINIGSNEKMDLISNSTNKITASDVYVFNFKVKDSVAAGTNVKISTGKISVDSDVAKDSETIVGEQSTTIKIASNSSNEEQKKDEEQKENEGTKTENPTNSQNKPISEKSTIDDKTGESKSDVSKTPVTSKASTKNESTTKSAKKLPKAGLVKGLGIAIVLLIAIVIICYNRYKYINI